MPKLSAYVGQAAAGGAEAAGRVTSRGPADAAVAVPLAHAAAARAVAALQPTLQQQQQQQAQPPPQQQQLSSSSQQQAGLSPQHEAAASKLQADFSKRVREHGPRTFRWPDGSLRPDRPPPNPHAVGNRRQWAELVRHCRTHGGDRAFERQGHSLRYGINVEHPQHEAYLRQIGLEPETGAGGDYKGDAEGLPGPLQDPDHCFRTYYKEGAEAVFKGARGRLL